MRNDGRQQVWTGIRTGAGFEFRARLRSGVGPGSLAPRAAGRRRRPDRLPTTRRQRRCADEPGVDPSVEKFRSCRWRATPDAGEFCTHRDVLPFAGKEGFKPESWCPECAFYKLRRTPKKRDRNDYMY